MKIKFSNDLKDNFESLVFFILYIPQIFYHETENELAILFDFATLFNLPELFNLKDDSNIFEIFIFGIFYIVLFFFIGLGLYLIYKIVKYLKSNININ